MARTQIEERPKSRGEETVVLGANNVRRYLVEKQGVGGGG